MRRKAEEPTGAAYQIQAVLLFQELSLVEAAKVKWERAFFGEQDSLVIVVTTYLHRFDGRWLRGRIVVENAATTVLASLCPALDLPEVWHLAAGAFVSTYERLRLF